MSNKNRKFVIIVALVFIAVVGYFAYERFSDPSTPNGSTKALIINTNSGNYEQFIDTTDSDYFSTKDENVKNIIKTHLAKQKEYPYKITDTQNYGYTQVYYYTKDSFIVGGKIDPANINVAGYDMYDMKTGQKINECAIYTNAGFYRDKDLLLSVSFKDNGVDIKYGACLYKRGNVNFAFLDVSSKLDQTETIFSDPAGQNLKAVIKNVNTQNKTFVVDVYDTTKKGLDNNYIYKRSVEVSY